MGLSSVKVELKMGIKQLCCVIEFNCQPIQNKWYCFDSPQFSYATIVYTCEIMVYNCEVCHQKDNIFYPRSFGVNYNYFFIKMGDICCSQRKPIRPTSSIVSVRQKSLIDPSTKKQYQKSLEGILNQALQKFQENYKINSLKLQGLIGKGGQASVFQVDVLCEEDGVQVIKKLAMKRVSKKFINKDQVREALLLEKQILTSRPSCFITQIEFACQDESYLYFFMKLAVGGDCYPFVRDQSSYSFNSDYESQDEFERVKQFNKLGQKAIIFILASVVLGLESLHSLNVIYRDLKPQNILIFEDGYPRLADFGVAAKYDDDDDLYFEMKGTILYFAPEIVKKKGYDRAIDFWALGVLAYQLTFKQPPFSTNYISSSIYQKKINERLQKDFWPEVKVSMLMKDFINRLLVVDPTKRLGYASYKEIKQHPLFLSMNWKLFESKKVASPLTEIIRKYPLTIKTKAQINEIVDQENHGYLPFTFVRNTTDTERKTVEIIPMTFVIDDHVNLKWEKDSSYEAEKG